ncbi:Nucleoporin NUP152 [Trametes pubescens]|uniref:Nucleoporin NUP152 n=1 Tax=Trametes pubescens TaxID=154538 RepID=A0A1M2VDU7_TRAPU|nr:Nucleoporin NUP152 [Trametes pubescens]
MPAPPSGFSGFKPIVSSSTPSSSSSGSGFVPKVDTGGSSTLGSPFSFAAPKPAGSESAASEAPKSSFSFGSSSATSTTSSAAPAPFTFGASASGSSLFSKPSASSSSTPSFFGSSAPSATSVFGSNLFGGKSSDASKDKDADKTEGKDSSNAISSSGSSSTFFGTSSTGGSNPFVTSTPEKTSPGGSSGFSFGSASPSKGNFFSGFPKAGSIGNPVGFGFGSPPKTPDAESADGPVKSLPFAFGAPKAAEPSGSDEKDASSGDGTPAPESMPVLAAGTSIHDQEGEGEEHEVTTHEVRSKVYKMTKDKDGNSQWGDLGVGVLRLKKHKETESRRMLLRNSSTGKITINFILYSGMNASVADKVVSFIGHDEGHSTPYRIRCKTAAQANELKAALNREIEFVKAKSEGS